MGFWSSGTRREDFGLHAWVVLRLVQQVLRLWGFGMLIELAASDRERRM